MVNYQNGRIYRLVCNVTGLQYVGSTCQPLHKRKFAHTSNYKQWKAGKFNYITSFKTLEHGDYDIFLIEEYACDNKQQLQQRERYWIEQTQCVNKCIPTRTDKEYQEANADRIRTYKIEHRQQNADQLRAKSKQYREVNAQQIKEGKRLHYQANVGHYKAYRREYYLRNAQRIKTQTSERITCQCGSSVGRGDIRRHERTKKHTEFIQNNIQS